MNNILLEPHQPPKRFSHLLLCFIIIIFTPMLVMAENTSAYDPSRFAGGGGKPSCKEVGDCDKLCDPGCPSNAQCQQGKCVCTGSPEYCCTANSCPSGYHCKNIRNGFGSGCNQCPCRKEPDEPLLPSLPGCEKAPRCQPSCPACLIDS